MKTAIFFFIDFFRNFRFAPAGAACRFHPSCSSYAKQAVDKYGIPRGLWMGAKRLSRCHPFSKGGYDPVE